MQSQPSDPQPAPAAAQSPAPVHALPVSVGTPSTPGTRKRGCTCKKSSCLKLYCECFASNTRCGERCQCLGCKNKEHNRLEIAHAIQAIEKRTQKAFRSPARVTRKLQRFHNMAASTSVSDPKGSSTCAASELAGEHTEHAEHTEQMHSHTLREACSCRGGICTSECPCLARFGGCEPACPCKGCQILQVTKTKGCSCKKSNCLKLYCECLAAQRVCSSRCHCECCKNRPEHHTERDRAVAAILERNPLAFQPKVASGSSQHLRGCNCRKSGCMKNYCECHQAGVPCTARCACHQCRNTEMLVTAKKLLIKAPDDTCNHGATRLDAMQRAVAGAGAPAKRLYRKASFDAPVTPSQQQQQHSSTALELLSRSAPPAVRPDVVYRGSTTPSKRDADGDIAHRHHQHHHQPERTNGVQPLFTKRKYSKVSARPLFMDRIAEAVGIGGLALPSVEKTIEQEFAVGDWGEPALAKLCRSLLHAALTVDAPPARIAQSSGAVAPEIRVVNGVKSPTRRASVSSDAVISPRSDELLCAEDIETPGDKTADASASRHGAQSVFGGQDAMRQAAQERAVLQEVSVWLRNLTAAALPGDSHTSRHF